MEPAWQLAAVRLLSPAAKWEPMQQTLLVASVKTGYFDAVIWLPVDAGAWVFVSTGLVRGWSELAVEFGEPARPAFYPTVESVSVFGSARRFVEMVQPVIGLA